MFSKLACSAKWVPQRGGPPQARVCRRAVQHILACRSVLRHSKVHSVQHYVLWPELMVSFCTLMSENLCEGTHIFTKKA